MSSILIKEYPTALVLYRCEKDATSVGGVSFRKQVISERGTNDIIIADFDKDGYMDMATVGFGGMSGIGGDPYVLLWLYRPNGFSSGSGGESSSDDCAFWRASACGQYWYDFNGGGGVPVVACLCVAARETRTSELCGQRIK